MALYSRQLNSSEYILDKQANDYVILTSIRSYALVKKMKVKKREYITQHITFSYIKETTKEMHPETITSSSSKERTVMK